MPAAPGVCGSDVEGEDDGDDAGDDATVEVGPVGLGGAVGPPPARIAVVASPSSVRTPSVRTS